MRQPCLNVLRIVCLNVFLSGAWAAGLDEARSAIEQWVRTRQIISQTQADWASDKDTLEQSLGFLERELKSVEEQWAKLSTNSVQVDQERSEAEALLKSSNESLEKSRQFAAGFEPEVRKLVPRLPTPLQDILKPFLNRLPTDAGSTQTSAPERVQVLAGLLSELDKFNNAVTVFSEKRTNEKGEEVAVETVYLGLGAAYFVNESGDFAGTGSPGSEGWEWTVKSDLASSVKEVLRIYRNERPARFIRLPAQIK